MGAKTVTDSTSREICRISVYYRLKTHLTASSTSITLLGWTCPASRFDSASFIHAGSTAAEPRPIPLLVVATGKPIDGPHRAKSQKRMQPNRHAKATGRLEFGDLSLAFTLCPCISVPNEHTVLLIYLIGLGPEPEGKVAHVMSCKQNPC